MKRTLMLAVLMVLVAAVAAHGDTVAQRLREGVDYVYHHPYADPNKNIEWGPPHALACLYLQRDVKYANELIQKYCRSHPVEPKASYARLPSPLLRVYLLPQCRELLAPETCRLIEQAAWNWVYARSRVTATSNSWNNASYGAWYITGSENHDVMFKATNLLAAQLLRDAPSFGPNAVLEDGGHLEEHYQAWVVYWKEYFRQRAREGLSCEIAHPVSYGASTTINYYNIFDLSDDAELKRLAGDFLTLFWTNVAAEFEPRTGIRAAWSATRCYKWSWHQQGAGYWPRSFLQAYGWHDNEAQPWTGMLGFLTSSYQPPEIVSAIAREKNRPCYLSTTRRFGLGGPWDPMTEGGGVYQVVFEDGRDSFIRRDTWYTPDYTISAIAVDPSRSYIALNTQTRVVGITFSADVDDRIMVLGDSSQGSHYAGKEKHVINNRAINAICRPGCLIAAREPNATGAAHTRIFISDGALWDNRQESPQDWLFTKAGDAYCALRLAHGKWTVKPSPYKTGYFLEPEDIWTPIVIQAGRAVDYKGGLDDFKQSVRKNLFTYEADKLTYVSEAGDKLKYFSRSRELPHINGKPVQLNPPQTYKNPWLVMDHGSDIAKITYPGYKDLTLDFTPPKR